MKPSHTDEEAVQLLGSKQDAKVTVAALDVDAAKKARHIAGVPAAILAGLCYVIASIAMVGGRCGQGLMSGRSVGLQSPPAVPARPLHAAMLFVGSSPTTSRPAASCCVCIHGRRMMPATACACARCSETPPEALAPCRAAHVSCLLPCHPACPPPCRSCSTRRPSPPSTLSPSTRCSSSSARSAWCWCRCARRRVTAAVRPLHLLAAGKPPLRLCTRPATFTDPAVPPFPERRCATRWA